MALQEPSTTKDTHVAYLANHWIYIFRAWRKATCPCKAKSPVMRTLTWHTSNLLRQGSQVAKPFSHFANTLSHV